MAVKSSKQSEASDTSLWHKYRTDLFFQTTLQIVVLQILLTTIMITGFWVMLKYLVRDTNQNFVDEIITLLKGKELTAAEVQQQLNTVQPSELWIALGIMALCILIFGFIMVYVALTPARRSMERKKRFISNIAHELRTPLAIIQTNTDVALMDNQVPEELRIVLEQNNAELERISEIINNLLSLTNFLRDGSLKFEEVDMSEVARRAMDTLSKTFDHKDISLVLKSHTQQTVFGNASALEQVAFNLIKNAIAHIESPGYITLEIDMSSDRKYVNLSVTDSGKGIARDDLFHIFEPFYRSRASTRKRGRGLGLAIVNEIVQMHQGKIRVQSALGRGTTVVVSLPKNPQHKAEQSEPIPEFEEIEVDFSNRILR